VLVVAAVVFEYPPDKGDGDDGAADEADPDADGEAEEAEGTAGRESDGPPAVGVEESDFRVAVVDLSVQSVFGEFPGLGSMGPVEIESQKDGHDRSKA